MMRIARQGTFLKSTLVLASTIAVTLGVATSLARASDPTSTRMAAALESVKVENLKSDLYFIASDEMAGRDTPSSEQRIVARFLRARLQRLGWLPGARDGYLHTYPLEQRKLDEEQSTITYQIEGQKGTLRFARDYFLPSNFDARPGRVSAKVVFAGKGTKEDFESKALEGKWAFVFDAGEDVRDLGRRARRAKCVGLMIAPGADYKGQPYEERFRPQLERQRRGSVQPMPKNDAGDKGDETPELFSTVMLTRASAERVLAAAKEPNTPRAGAALGEFTEVRMLAGGGKVDVENVVGLWPGSDPVLGKETILISAHYDHIGVSSDGRVNNGADDNGSGTSGLLAIAEALSAHGPLRRSVMLIWVSGEEKGLWGSKAWCDDAYLPDDRKPICDINIDMIGRNAPDLLLVTPTAKRAKDYNGLVAMAESLSALEGFPVLGSADEYYTRSDHANFAKLGIPVMFLFSDVHEDYHKPTDDADKIDFDKVRRVSRLVLRIVDGLQADTLDLGKR